MLPCLFINHERSGWEGSQRCYTQPSQVMPAFCCPSTAAMQNTSCKHLGRPKVNSLHRDEGAEMGLLDIKQAFPSVEPHTSESCSTWSAHTSSNDGGTCIRGLIAHLLPCQTVQGALLVGRRGGKIDVVAHWRQSRTQNEAMHCELHHAQVGMVLHYFPHHVQDLDDR